MGNTIQSNVQPNELYDTIVHEIHTIIHNRYKGNIDKCRENDKELIPIYNNTLIRLGSGVLSDIPITLGYRYDEKTSSEICAIIIDHYRRRIKLLDLIYDTLEHSKNAIEKVKNGNYCYIDANISDANEYADISLNMGNVKKCIGNNNYPNVFWIDKIYLNKIKRSMSNDPEYSKYRKMICNMDNKFYSDLKKISGYVGKIKNDIDNPMSKEEFNNIEKEIIDIVIRIKKDIDLFYTLSLKIINKF